MAKQICELEERLKTSETTIAINGLNGEVNGLTGSMTYILPVDQQLNLEPDSIPGTTNISNNNNKSIAI